MADLELDIHHPIEETPAAIEGQDTATVVAEDSTPECGAVAPPPVPPKRKKKKKLKSKPASKTYDEKTLMAYGLRDLIKEEDLTPQMLKSYLGGPILVGFFKHHWKSILVVAGMFLVYIYVGYEVDDSLYRLERLSVQVEDRRLKSLVISSELRERTLGSNVSKELVDTTLHVSSQQSFRLPVKKTSDDE